MLHGTRSVIALAAALAAVQAPAVAHATAPLFHHGPVAIAHPLTWHSLTARAHAPVQGSGSLPGSVQGNPASLNAAPGQAGGKAVKMQEHAPTGPGFNPLRRRHMAMPLGAVSDVQF